MKTLEMAYGDLVITNHNFVMLDNKNTLRQRISNRLSLYLGEFSLVPEEGIDWLTVLSVKYPKAQIGDAVIAEIKKDTEVVNVVSLEVIFIDTPELAKKYNKKMRTALINCKCNTLYGELDVNV